MENKLSELKENSAEIHSMLSRLKALGYRITAPFSERSQYAEHIDAIKLSKAIVLDTETTGTDINDRLIELGMVLFEYDPVTGQAYRVLETFDELQDPGIPIPSESTKIHGISDEMVKNKSIDLTKVKQLLNQSSLIIAHNAKFDRRFVETTFPDLGFDQKPWACTFEQIPWTEEGLGSAKLEFLAYQFGFHYVAHRASNDCHALLEILQKELPKSREKALQPLLRNAELSEFRLAALNSPFDAKDVLKTRKYRWDSDKKVWSIFIPKRGLESEVKWLKENVYGGKEFQIELEELDAFNRYTNRRGLAQKFDY